MDKGMRKEQGNDSMGLKKVQEKARARQRFFLFDLLDLVEDSEVDSLYDVGIEILDSNTGERICYRVDSAWINDEWEELTLTVNVDKLPQIIE